MWRKKIATPRFERRTRCGLFLLTVEQSMRVISYDTYAQFAKKYNIPLKTTKGRAKSLGVLAKQIYAHEKSKPKLKGLYFT